MSSIRRWAPDVRRFVLLADRPDGYFNPADEDFEIIASEDLPIPDSRRSHFKYTILELSTAVKPFALEVLFDRFGCDQVVYLDPDIKVYAGLEPLLKTLGSHSALLTPHLTDPLEDDRRPSELDILRSGAYNLWFIALRACPATREVAEQALRAVRCRFRQGLVRRSALGGPGSRHVRWRGHPTRSRV